VFRYRIDLCHAKVHGETQRGIHGLKESGAYSIVLYVAVMFNNRAVGKMPFTGPENTRMTKTMAGKCASSGHFCHVTTSLTSYISIYTGEGKRQRYIGELCLRPLETLVRWP
jgi:hypothetical protein